MHHLRGRPATTRAPRGRRWCGTVPRALSRAAVLGAGAAGAGIPMTPPRRSAHRTVSWAALRHWCRGRPARSARRQHRVGAALVDAQARASRRCARPRLGEVAVREAREHRRVDVGSPPRPRACCRDLRRPRQRPRGRSPAPPAPTGSLEGTESRRRGHRRHPGAEVLGGGVAVGRVAEVVVHVVRVDGHGRRRRRGTGRAVAPGSPGTAAAPVRRAGPGRDLVPESALPREHERDLRRGLGRAGCGRW